MRTHQWKKTKISSLDVYSDTIQNIMTRHPENMSNVIPEGVYMTLVGTHRQSVTQAAIHPHPCRVCDVFLCPLCPSRERLVVALCLNPLFGPSGTRYHSSGILTTPGPCVNSLQTRINANTHTCSCIPSCLLNTLTALPLVRHYQLYAVFSSPQSTSRVFYWPHQCSELSLSGPFGPYSPQGASPSTSNF